MTLRRLYPEGTPVSAEQAAEELRREQAAPAERPRLVVNMVSTADGAAAVEGRSGPIGGEADRELFHALRGQADAVLVGARTLAIERYGRLIKDPVERERRVARGLTPEPLACVVTRSGQLALDAPLFQDEDSTVVVYTAAPLDTGACRATVVVTRMEPSRLSLAAALGALRSEHGVEFVLCEGGPLLLGGLLRERTVDELLLTVAPRLVGGRPSLTTVDGPCLPEPRRLRLLWALESQGELMLRYAVEG